MKLWCYDDHKGWGLALCAAAHNRHHTARMFGRGEAHKPDEGVVFVHMHHSPKHREHDKEMLEVLHRNKNLRVIPDLRSARLYDNKIAQYQDLAMWMPTTFIITQPSRAAQLVERQRYPFISKSSEGAGSHNVRLIRDRNMAEAEIEAVFHGEGIPCRYGQRQKGYLFWQEFIPGNTGDVRVIAMGRQRLALLRQNRDDRPMASGSGITHPVTALDDPHTASAFHYADYFFTRERFTWCGIDLVFDRELSRWMVLETTVGWTLEGYVDCRFFPDGRYGGSIWDVVLDEIEAGAL